MDFILPDSDTLEKLAVEYSKLKKLNLPTAAAEKVSALSVGSECDCKRNCVLDLAAVMLIISLLRS